MSESSPAPPTSTDDIREVLSTIYHDLNNPLSIIAGNAQFLRELMRDADMGEPYMSSVEDIQEAAERISTSLNELVEMKEQLNGNGTE